MSFVFRLFWLFRALIFKFFFGSIGYFSYIGPPLFLNNVSKIFIGRKVRIFPHSRLEVVDKMSRICIGDNVSIGHNFHIVSGCGQNLIVSSNCTISSNVFISNVNHTFSRNLTSCLSLPLIENETYIGENTFIGCGAVILPGALIGKNCVVGANAVVKGIFPDFSIIAGVPARVIGSVR